MENSTSKKARYLELEPYNKGQVLEGIFKMQEHLMSYYIENSSLPQIVDINTKDGQKFIRGLGNYITEEFIEALYEAEKLNLAMGEGDKDTALNIREAFIEELVDVTHFVVELSMYLGITNHNLGILIKDRAEKYKIGNHIKKEPLSALLQIANHIQIFNLGPQNPLDFYKLMSNDAVHLHKYSHEAHSRHRELTLDCIASTFGALSYLKTKEWRKSKVKVNLAMMQEQVFELWLNLASIYNNLQFKPEHIYLVFRYKHKKNIDRINTNW